MRKNEIDFMKYYISLLYKKGYCYFDVSSDYLNEYLKELKKVMEYKNMFKEYKYLENIFIHDYVIDEYTNFINTILYVTACPKNSFYCEKANIIMINYTNSEIDNILNSENSIDLNKVDEITDYMSNYLNLHLKIKIITNNKNH